MVYLKMEFAVYTLEGVSCVTNFITAYEYYCIFESVVYTKSYDCIF